MVTHSKYAIHDVLESAAEMYSFKSKCLISQTGPFPSKGIIGQPCLATILIEIWIYQISEEYLPKEV